MAGLVAISLAVGCSSQPPTTPRDDAAPPPREVEREAEPPEGSGEEPEQDEQDRAEVVDRSAVATPGPPPPSRARIEAEARTLLTGLLERAEGERIVVLVVDEAGREVISHEPDASVLPASTLKIVTAAAALITYGPSARFTTRIESTGPVDDRGVVAGDLVLVGGGDPVLATPEFGRWIYPARPRTPFEDLADQLVEAGVTRIDGDVLGVVDRFEGPTTATGWPDRYFSDFDARHADGLAVDAGTRTIVTYPDEEEEGGSEDDAPGEGARAPAGPSDEDGELREPPTVKIEHTATPAQHAVAELVRLLEERDIEVAGTTAVREPDRPLVGRLAAVSSPPLEELLRFAMQRSDNQMADALFRAVGRHRTGIGSFASGEVALRQVLASLGIEHGAAAFADGSGLSRDDRVTARLLVEVDRAMLGSRHAPTWSSLMAEMGRSGTLENRLRGTVAEGRFLGKTGTLRDVSALTGTVHGDGPRRYHLAVIANTDGQARWLARTFADELIVLLAADLQGCEIGQDRDGDGALGRDPIAVAC
ncbi:MAG: D-alanyl-D-alanine carboxypeptidase/D-alanyl-D-alanine-endopeptidase [Nitriliruptoraceae bacterium]